MDVPPWGHCRQCRRFMVSISKYCSRECRDQYWIAYKREKRVIEMSFPMMRCGKCGRLSTLDFWPKDEPERVESWKCPLCGYEKNAQ